MRRLLAAALLAGVVLAGCGVTTVDQTIDASLIRQVGAGSNTVASIVPTIQAQAKVPGSFSDPQINQAVTLLLQGQLAKLTQDDLVRIANANRSDAQRFPVALGKLDTLASSIASQSIDANAYRNLSGGAKQFIAVWNRYLAAAAGEVRAMRQALSGLGPVFNEYQALLRAAYNTARLRSVVQFDKVKHAFLNDVGPRFTRVQNALKAAVAQTPADRKLIGLVDHNQEAQAIVKKVNHDYPNGSLAQEFKAS